MNNSIQRLFNDLFMHCKTRCKNIQKGQHKHVTVSKHIDEYFEQKQNKQINK